MLMINWFQTREAIPYNRERVVFFSINDAWTSEYLMQKNEVGTYHMLYTKINSKWIVDLNVKLLEKSIEVNFHDLGFTHLCVRVCVCDTKVHSRKREKLIRIRLHQN